MGLHGDSGRFLLPDNLLSDGILVQTGLLLDDAISMLLFLINQRLFLSLLPGHSPCDLLPLLLYLPSVIPGIIGVLVLATLLVIFESISWFISYFYVLLFFCRGHVYETYLYRQDWNA